MSLKKVIKTLVQTLDRSHVTLSVAESCTGGLLSAHITELPGVSKIYFGSVVTYANEAKHDLLGVSRKTLKRVGAVSPEVALEMAKGVKKAFGSQWAVSITGIAGPSGGTKLKPVGLVFVAVVGPNVELVQKNVFKGNRKTIQTKAAAEVAGLLLKSLKKR